MKTKEKLNLKYSTFTEENIITQPKAVYLFYKKKVDDAQKEIDEIKMHDFIQISLNLKEIILFLSDNPQFVSALRQICRELDKEEQEMGFSSMAQKVNNMNPQFDLISHTFTGKFMRYFVGNNGFKVEFPIPTLASIFTENEIQTKNVKDLQGKINSIVKEYNEIIRPINPSIEKVGYQNCLWRCK